MSETPALDEPQPASAAAVQARAFAAARRWAEAAAAYQSALAVPGEHRSALLADAGKALFKAQRFREALTPLCEAVLANPSDYKSARRLALAVRRLEMGTTEPEPAAQAATGGVVPRRLEVEDLLKRPEPELCRLLLSDRSGEVYRSAVTGLATGAFMTPDRLVESELLEKVVVAHYLSSARRTTAPAGPFESLDDLIVGFLRSLPGYLIFVYSMGNTGSNQLFSSLTDANADGSDLVIAFHQYYNRKIRLVESKIRKACVVKHALHLGQRLDSKVKIVSTVRDPLSRVFSAYMYKEILSGRLDAAIQAIGEGVPVDAAVWIAMNQQFEVRVRKSVRDDFFTSQVAAASGISIYDYPIDMSDGFTIVRKHGLELLILRTERIEGCASRAFRELLGREIVPVPVTDSRVKVTSMRDNPAYREFLTRMRLDSALFEELYGAPWVRRLYSPDEIGHARERWRGNLV